MRARTFWLTFAFLLITSLTVAQKREVSLHRQEQLARRQSIEKTVGSMPPLRLAEKRVMLLLINDARADAGKAPITESRFDTLVYEEMVEIEGERPGSGEPFIPADQDITVIKRIP